MLLGVVADGLSWLGVAGCDAPFLRVACSVVWGEVWFPMFGWFVFLMVGFDVWWAACASADCVGLV